MAHPYFRFLVALVGTVLALRVAWALLRPLLPVLVVVLAAFALWQLVSWYRSRW